MNGVRRSSRKFAVRCFRCWKKGRSLKAVHFCRMITCANWPNKSTSPTYRIMFSMNMPRMPSKHDGKAADQGLPTDPLARCKIVRILNPIYHCDPCRGDDREPAENDFIKQTPNQPAVRLPSRCPLTAHQRRRFRDVPGYY